LALSLLFLPFLACAGGSGSPSQSGGSTDSAGNGSGGSASGGSTASGGTVSGGGNTGSGGENASGGNKSGGIGGGTSGVAGAGGSAAPSGGAGGASPMGGSSGSGGAPNDAAADGSASTSYALPPPSQSMNQFFIQGCQAGVATSPGGGNCTPGQNACEGTKSGAQINFICPRVMLFSDEMAQAAADDGNGGINYGVVGHDADTGGIDSTSNSCCQCYQLVFSLPENVAQVGGNGAAAIPIPPPLVVQSFNTAAGGGKNFDIYMGAGGFGAFNACDPNASQKSPSGKYLYTQFPPEGEPGSGGVNAATQIAGCQSNNLVTTATLSSSTCQTNVATACSKFTSASSTTTSESIRSCTKSNDANSYYHMNWKVYAKHVECPTHLMEVTGCKLATAGLPAVNPAVKTPEQAAADSSFKSGYTITTMQDCCMPTCAWQNNVTGQNVSVTGKYNSFYSCDGSGVPRTEP
jgi:hypothetical protein